MKTLFEAGNQPTDEYSNEYREWMYTPSNAFRCAECPERRENWRGHEYPCCQQNCWVEVTCYPDSFRI